MTASGPRPFQITGSLTGVDDATLQAKALEHPMLEGWQLGVDPDADLLATGAGDPGSALASVLMAALRIGLAELLPDAGVTFSSAGRPQ